VKTTAKKKQPVCHQHAKTACFPEQFYSIMQIADNWLNN